MNTLYLDIFSGISGDMFVGAMLDLGVEAQALESEIAKLGLQNEYHLHVTRGQKGSIAGTKFDVHLQAHPHPAPEHPHHAGPAHAHPKSAAHTHHGDHHEHGRTFARIRTMIGDSHLSPWVKTRAVAVFERVAVAEGKIHGRPAEQVHFHEVGAVDSIVDIVGSCVCLELLGKPRVLAAPVVEGQGWVQCAHGRFPIPTAATLEILGARGVALTQCEEPHELVTPTGAALLAEFAESFSPMRQLTPHRIGYGLGTRDNQTRPNVLRAVLGETGAEGGGHDWERDEIAVLETNLDDASPEILGAFVERALASGALDVFSSSVVMKKNRPGVLLTVLCPESEAEGLTLLMLRETTAFGVRRSRGERCKLRREVVPVSTRYGTVQVKLGRLNGQILQAAPEFESCREVARAAGVPLKEVFEAARAAWDRLEHA